MVLISTRRIFLLSTVLLLTMQNNQHTVAIQQSNALGQAGYLMQMTKSMSSFASVVNQKLTSLSENQKVLNEIVKEVVKEQAEVKEMLEEVSKNYETSQAHPALNKPGADLFNSFENLEPPIVINARNSGLDDVISFWSSGNQTWKRKFWVLETRGSGQLTLDKNNMAPSAELTLTGFVTTGLKRSECYMSYNTPNGTTCDFGGEDTLLCIVTLSLRSSGTYYPEDLRTTWSFRLRYKTSQQNYTAWTVAPVSIITNPVPQFISFPQNNLINYTPKTLKPTLIAPFTKTPFNLTLTYLSTQKYYDFLWVYLIGQQDGHTTFKKVPRNYSGSLNDYSGPHRLIGQAAAAVLLFKSDATNESTGYGVKLDI